MIGKLIGLIDWLTLSTLGKIFSRRHFEIFFPVFFFLPRKQVLTFHENCLQQLHEIANGLQSDNLHEMSNSVLQ